MNEKNTEIPTQRGSTFSFFFHDNDDCVIDAILSQVGLLFYILLKELRLG